MSKTKTDVDHSIKYYYALQTENIANKSIPKYESTSPEHIKHTKLLIKNIDLLITIMSFTCPRICCDVNIDILSHPS